MYPPRFALRIAKYYDRFCKNSQPLWSQFELPALSSMDVFQSMSWEDDTWDDAGLIEAFLYLRGSKGLELGDWRPLLPTTV